MLRRSCMGGRVTAAAGLVPDKGAKVSAVSAGAPPVALEPRVLKGLDGL